MASSSKQHAAAAADHEPNTVALMHQLLQSMGVDQFEPRMVNQLVDFMYRYVTDVLLDAETYAEHASEWSMDMHHAS